MEAQDISDTTKDGPMLSARYLRSLGESIKIEADGDDEPILTETPKPRKTVGANTTPKDPRISEAETWRAQYKESHGASVRAAPSSLRAYRMWHCNPELNPEAIAKLLREPPLQTLTVANYVLEAVRLEKLPYDTSRLQAEVLDLLPKDIRNRRYKTLVKACEDAARATNTDNE
jgi:hypothetical protein